MSMKRKLQPLRRICLTCLIVFGGFLYAYSSMAQVVAEEKAIDPRLVEITQIVKTRVLNPTITQNSSKNPTQDEVYLGLVDQMQTSLYTQDVDKITEAVRAFDHAYSDGGALSKICQFRKLV